MISLSLGGKWTNGDIHHGWRYPFTDDVPVKNQRFASQKNFISGPEKLVDDLRDTNLVIGSDLSESTKPGQCVLLGISILVVLGFLDDFIIIWIHIMLWELYFTIILVMTLKPMCFDGHFPGGSPFSQASHVYFWPPFLSCHWACRWACRWAIDLSGPQLDNPEIFFKGYHGI